MKKKIINIVVIISCIIVLIELLLNKILVFDTISYSLETWINSILPSLFPFFVIGNVLINLGFPKFLGELLKKQSISMSVNPKEVKDFIDKLTEEGKSKEEVRNILFNDFEKERLARKVYEQGTDEIMTNFEYDKFNLCSREGK